MRALVRRRGCGRPRGVGASETYTLENRDKRDDQGNLKKDDQENLIVLTGVTVRILRPDLQD